MGNNTPNIIILLITWSATATASRRLTPFQQQPDRQMHKYRPSKSTQGRNERRSRRVVKFEQQIKVTDCQQIVSLLQNDHDWMKLPNIQVYAAILKKCQTAEVQNDVIESLLANDRKRSWDNHSHVGAFMELKEALFEGKMMKQKQEQAWVKIITKMGTFVSQNECKDRMIKIIEHYMSCGEQAFAIEMMGTWYGMMHKTQTEFCDFFGKLAVWYDEIKQNRADCEIFFGFVRNITESWQGSDDLVAWYERIVEAHYAQ